MVGVEDETPLDYVSNAYLLLDLKLISQIYAALGDTSTSQRYAKIRDEVYTAFQRRFYDAKTHFYANGSQTAQALALELGLVPDSKRQLVFAELAKDVEQLGRLDVGIIGARVLLRALSDGGRSDLAFLVATHTEKPGWGFWMKSGATTLWEGWNRGASLNHIMYGDVSAWFYAWIAGIQQEPDSIAFERILFRPNPVGGLREASGSYLSARGRVSSAWRLKGNIMDLSLEVPCGATARLILPARAKLESSYSIGTIDPGGTTEPRFASGHHEVRIQLLA